MNLTVHLHLFPRLRMPLCPTKPSISLTRVERGNALTKWNSARSFRLQKKGGRPLWANYISDCPKGLCQNSFVPNIFQKTRKRDCNVWCYSITQTTPWRTGNRTMIHICFPCHIHLYEYYYVILCAPQSSGIFRNSVWRRGHSLAANPPFFFLEMAAMPHVRA
jgi:hypothetical protein